MDKMMMVWVRQHRTPFMDWLLEIITWAGSLYLLLPLSLLLAVRFMHNKFLETGEPGYHPVTTPNGSLMRAIAFPVMILVVTTFAASGRAAEPVVIDGDVPAEGGFRIVTLLQGLEHPWSMAWLPNGNLLISERLGRLRLVKGGRLIATPVDAEKAIWSYGHRNIQGLVYDSL